MSKADKTADAPALRASGLTKEYQDGTRTLRVLRGAELSARAGEIVSITGASGSGKSTLLHLLGGLDRPSGGQIQFGGRELHAMTESELSRLRAREIGIIFQFYHLLPEFSATENVMIPQMLLGMGKREAREKALAALDRVGLSERANHRPSKMSGGEQQRVAIARAMINRPSLVLADEPTGNLDPQTGGAIIDLLWNASQETGAALIIVTHEPVLADKADRQLKLEQGKLLDA
ncbi:ABC transporter ATP-binding protein [Candidatus Sumerlaeota bacterium]|nr:ABC transporter ATP-binding protein [Candidatus Sumerlaeota bacterium]